MASAQVVSRKGGSSNVNDLTQAQWSLLAVPAIILAVMAILQLLSFSHFKDWLESIRIGWPAAVAALIIVAELLGSVSLLQVPMSHTMRFVGLSLALLVSGFWFFENLMLVTGTKAEELTNSGFFGKYLAQTPGWWTIIEATVLLGLVIYAAELLSWRPRNWR